MKVLFFITLVIGLVIPCTLWAKNMALELDGKGGFGKANYIDVTKDLDLTPLSIEPGDKLTTTWAWVKQTR